jgi:hypothetical protein
MTRKPWTVPLLPAQISRPPKVRTLTRTAVGDSRRTALPRDSDSRVRHRGKDVTRSRPLPQSLPTNNASWPTGHPPPVWLSAGCGGGKFRRTPSLQHRSNRDEPAGGIPWKSLEVCGRGRREGGSRGRRSAAQRAADTDPWAIARKEGLSVDEIAAQARVAAATFEHRPLPTDTPSWDVTIALPTTATAAAEPSLPSSAAAWPPKAEGPRQPLTRP